MREIYLLLHAVKKQVESRLLHPGYFKKDRPQCNGDLSAITSFGEYQNTAIFNQKKLQMHTSTFTPITNRQLATGKAGFNRWMMALVITVLAITTSLTSKAQLTGTKTIPVDYPTLAAAITDLNTQGVGAGGVFITIAPGNPQTAPAGGYVIGGTGSAVLTTSSLSNPIEIYGDGNTVTAGVQTAGNLNDGIFKLVGADWVNLHGFTMQENPANTVTTVASNTKTEWGVAMLIVTDADGAQHNLIHNNTITLSNNYSNSFGIYANARHFDGPNSVDVTGLTSLANNTTAPNSDNNVHTNTVTANMGIVFVGSNVVTAMDMNNVFGSLTPGTGNIINNFGVGGPLGTAYTGVIATDVIGMYIANQINYGVYNNSVSTSLASAAPMRGIYADYLNQTTVAGTNNISNNTISMTQAGAGGFRLIQMGNIGPFNFPNITQNVNNNNFINNAITAAGSAVTIIGVLNFENFANLNINNNIFRNNTSTATTGGFQGITCQGFSASTLWGISGTLNINDNQFGDAGGGAISFSAANSGQVLPIFTSGGANTSATVNILRNSFQGFSFLSSTGLFVGIVLQAGTPLMMPQGGLNINENLFGSATVPVYTYTNASSAAFTGIQPNFANVATANTPININNNVFRNMNDVATGSGAVTFVTIPNTSTIYTNTTNINNNQFNNITLNRTGSVTFFLRAGNMSATGIENVNNNSIVTGFNKTGAGGTILFYSANSSSVNGSQMNNIGNNFSNITVTGATTISGWSNTEGASSTSAPVKTITGNTFNNIIGGSNGITGATINFSGAGTVFSNNSFQNYTGTGAITGFVYGTSNAQATHTVSNNTVSSLVSSGTGGSVIGISVGSGTTAGTILNATTNTVSTLSSTGASSTVTGMTVTGGLTVNANANRISGLSASGVTSLINGMSVSAGTTVTLNGNKVCDVNQSGANTSAPGINGMLFSGGTTVNVINNIVGNLTAPAAVSADAIRGLSKTNAAATTSWNVYYNTVYLNASSSGATFGTTALFHTTSATATTGRLDLRNNILVNNSTPGATAGVVSVMRRGTAAQLGNYALTSNSNLMYAGTPSATSVILNDNGTVYSVFGPAATAGTFQNLVTTRESLSFTEPVPVTAGGPTDYFQSLNCTLNGTYLHMTNGLTTQVEGGANPIAGITTDFDGNTRSTTLPDVGADEFTGVNPAPTFANVTVPTATCTVSGHLISADITTLSGTITTVTLNYNNGAAGSVTMTQTPATNTWTGTIPAGTPGATTTWSISATSSVPITRVFTGAPYVDDPLSTVTLTPAASVNPVCSGAPTSLSVAVTPGSVVPTAYSWSDGVGVVGTTNPLIVNPTSATTYTVTVTALGCTKAASILVNTTVLPNQPIGSNSSQCGFGIPTNAVVTQFVTPDVSSGAFKWYDAQFGGNLLQTGGSTYALPINTTTTFWVSESNGTCESLRTPLVATVTQPDPVSAHSTNLTPCLNTSFDLSATNDAGSPTNIYTYSWNASPLSGSGLSGPTSGSPLTVTPTAVGTYTYTVTAVDGSCTTVASIVITVNALPAPVVITPPAATICAGQSVTLNGVSKTTGTTTAASGTLNLTIPDINTTGINNALAISGIPVGATIDSIVATVNMTYSSGFNSDALVNLQAPNGQVINLISGNNGIAGAGTNTNFTNTRLSSDDSKPLLSSGANPWTGTFRADKFLQAAFQAGFSPNPAVTTNTFSSLYGTPNGNWTIRAYDDESILTGVLNNWNLKISWSTPSSPITWSPAGGLNTTSGSTVIASPTTTTTYTATATGANTCTISNTVTVTVNQLPALPSGTNSEQCGTKIPEANVSSNSGAPTPIFRWYDAPAPGGNLLQTGTSATYLTAISATTEFYVAEVSAEGCEGPRVHITGTVNAPDDIVASVSAAPYCMNSPITLTVNHTQVNNIYNFVWTATPTAGSGMPTPVQGDDGNGVDGGNPIPVNVTATLNGTYTYTVTADDPVRGCTNTSSVTVTINPLPTSVLAASTGTPCVGGTIGLTSSAQTGGPAPINFTAGFEGTFPPSGWTIINNATGSTWIAANTIGGATFHTGSNAMGILFNAQVTDAYAFTPAQALIGGHTYALSYWYKTNSIGGALPENLKVRVGTLATVAGQTTLLQNRPNLINETYLQSTVNFTPTVSGNYFFSFNANNPANTSNLLAIDDVAIVDLTPLVITSYNWVSNNSNPVFTSNVQNPTGVVINEPTIYTVTVTNSFGCSQSASTALVTPNPLPAAPIGTNSSQCGLRVPTASVATGGSNGTYRWYDAEFGGNLLQTGGSTYTTAISTTTTFWVSESNGTCESLRTAVTVTVATPDPVSAHVDNPVVCANSPIQLSATNDNPTPTNTYVYTWTATPVPGSGIPTNVVGSPVNVTPTAAGTYTYLVTAFDVNGPFGGCTTTATVPVTVNALPAIVTITPAAPSICNGGNVVLNAVAGGSGAATATSGTISVAIPDFNTTGINNAMALSGVPPGVTIDSIIATVNITYASGFNSDVVVNLEAPNGQIINLISGNNGIAGSGTNTNFTNTRVSSDDSKPLLSSGANPWTGTFRADKFLMGAFQASFALTPPVTTAVWSDLYGTPNGTWRIRVYDDESIISGTLTNWQLKVAYSSPAATITWSPATGLSATTGSPVTANPTTTTTYTATATNGAGCTTSTNVTVTVVDPSVAPTANGGTGTVNSCSGAAVLLDAHAIFGGTGTYSWTDNDPLTTDPISTSASFTVNPTTTTTYTVTVTDACNVTSPAGSVTVNVNPLPTASIAEGPGPLAICDPSTQTLTAVTTTGSPSYQWTLNGVNIGGATSSTYVVSGVSSGAYRVIVTETTTTCSTTSAPVTVTINQKPSAVVVTPPAPAICIGQSQVLTASGGSTFVPATAVITGTSPTTTTGTTSPFYRLWEGSKKQYMVSVAELAAQGLVAGSSISSVSFNVTALSRTTDINHNGFNIKIGTTTDPNLSTAFVTGLNTVYGPTTYNPVVGANVFNFSSALTWDGTSNVVIEICFDNDPTNTCDDENPICWSNAATVSAATGFAGCVREIHDDNNEDATRGDICPLTTTISNGVATSTLRPVMTFGASVGSAGVYTWSPSTGLNTTSGATVTATPTVTTTYTVTSTIASTGCSNQTDVTVTVNQLPVITIDPVTTPTCLNSGTQTLSASPAGGTFSGPGVTGNTFDPAVAGAGTHTITYAYTNPTTGCSNTATTSILVNALPNAPTISIVDNANGTSTITASNYTGTLTWSNGGSDNPHIVTAAGPYTVTQTSLTTGCTSLPSNIVTAGPSITADPALGGMDITDLADVSQNANTLAHAQVYKLYLPVYNFEQDFAVPNGATTITIDLGSKLVVDPSFNLATAPLSAYFSWTHAVVLGHDIITGSQIAALPGDFDNMAIFQVVSSGSCVSKITANFIVDNHASVIALNDLVPANNQATLQYGLPTTVSAVATNVVCNGAADGTITITASEGTTVTVNGLPPSATYGPGTYTIVASAPSDVAPFTPCTATTTVTITEPTLLVATIVAQTNVIGCFGDQTGAAAVIATGGTPGYSYSWNTVPVQTNQIATGLGAGTYTVTVTDANGCTKTASVTITEPPQVIISISAQTNVDCNGNSTGSATVEANGGTPGYTYSWNTIPVQNTATATGLPAGTYTVVVLDSHGCSATTTVTITEPAVLTAVASIVSNVTCNGAANGSATVVPGGGTAPYTYVWSNGQHSQTAINLAPGTYSVQVTDDHGCVTTSNNVTVTEPDVLTVAINSSTNNTCHNGSTGSITADASGGTVAYVYTIAGPTVNTTGQTTGTFTGLSAGSYTITVTDAQGCTATSSTVVVTQPAGLFPDISLGSDYTANFFAANGATNTIVYNVSEIAGNPAVGDTIRLTKVAGYQFTFNSSTTAVTIGSTPYAVDNSRWKVDISNPAFVSLIFDPAHNSTPGMINCGEVVYISIDVTRNTPNLSTFTLSGRLRRANTEVNLSNNLNSIVFTAE